MTIQINYKNIGSKKDLTNLALFVDENFNINNLKKYLSNLEFSYISDLLKNSDLKKDLLFFEVNSKKTLFLVSIKKDIEISDIENLGAKFHSYINYDKKKEYFVNSDTINNKLTSTNQRENFIKKFIKLIFLIPKFQNITSSFLFSYFNNM
jgi:leucyl aminopeptidase